MAPGIVFWVLLALPICILWADFSFGNEVDTKQLFNVINIIVTGQSTPKMIKENAQLLPTYKNGHRMNS